MSTIRVAVDLDGVLADFNTSFRLRLEQVTGRPDPQPKTWEPPQWDYPALLGYRPKDTIDAWDSIKQDDTFWANLSPYPGAHKFLDWLWNTVSFQNWTQGASHEVVFLSDRTGLRAKDQSELWLRRHGYGGKPPTVLLTRRGKGRILADLEITHFLDDKPENIQDCRIYSSSTAACLLVRPWNQGRVCDPEVRMMASLHDFQRLISSEM